MKLIDKQFICALLKEASLHLALDAKVQESWLEHPYNQIFKYIKTHYIQYGKVPNEATINEKFPDFEYEEQQENTLFYVDSLKTREQVNLASKLVKDIHSALTTASTVEEKAKALITVRESIHTASSKLALDLSMSKMKDVFLEGESIFNAYLDRKNPELIQRNFIPTPWETLNEDIIGWEAGDFVTILGASGLGKTWALLLCLLLAQQKGRKVLLFTEEMTINQLAFRLMSMKFEIPFERMRSGALNDFEEQDLRSSILDLVMKRKAEEETGFIINQGSGQSGTDAMASIIRHVRPDIVGIDGAYLFAEGYDWSKIAEMTGALKHLALVQGTRIICTNQVAAKNSSTKSAFSPSFINDASVCLQLFKDPDKKYLPFMNFRKVKCRDSSSDKEVFITNWDFERMNFDERLDLLPDQVIFEE